MKRYFAIGVKGKTVYLQTENCNDNLTLEFDVVNEAVKEKLITIAQGNKVFERDIEELDEQTWKDMIYAKCIITA